MFQVRTWSFLLLNRDLPDQRQQRQQQREQLLSTRQLLRVKTNAPRLLTPQPPNPFCSQSHPKSLLPVARFKRFKVSERSESSSLWEYEGVMSQLHVRIISQTCRSHVCPEHSSQPRETAPACLHEKQSTRSFMFQLKTKNWQKNTIFTVKIKILHLNTPWLPHRD